MARPRNIGDKIMTTGAILGTAISLGVSSLASAAVPPSDPVSEIDSIAQSHRVEISQIEEIKSFQSVIDRILSYNPLSSYSLADDVIGGPDYTHSPTGGPAQNSPPSETEKASVISKSPTMKKADSSAKAKKPQAENKQEEQPAKRRPVVAHSARKESLAYKPIRATMEERPVVSDVQKSEPQAHREPESTEAPSATPKIEPTPETPEPTVETPETPEPKIEPTVETPEPTVETPETPEPTVETPEVHEPSEPITEKPAAEEAEDTSYYYKISITHEGRVIKMIDGSRDEQGHLTIPKLQTGDDKKEYFIDSNVFNITQRDQSFEVKAHLRYVEKTRQLDDWHVKVIKGREVRRFTVKVRYNDRYDNYQKSWLDIKKITPQKVADASVKTKDVVAFLNVVDDSLITREDNLQSRSTLLRVSEPKKDSKPVPTELSIERQQEIIGDYVAKIPNINSKSYQGKTINHILGDDYTSNNGDIEGVKAVNKRFVAQYVSRVNGLRSQLNLTPVKFNEQDIDTMISDLMAHGRATHAKGDHTHSSGKANIVNKKGNLSESLVPAQSLRSVHDLTPEALADYAFKLFASEYKYMLSDTSRTGHLQQIITKDKVSVTGIAFIDTLSKSKGVGLLSKMDISVYNCSLIVLEYLL